MAVNVLHFEYSKCTVRNTKLPRTGYDYKTFCVTYIRILIVFGVFNDQGRNHI